MKNIFSVGNKNFRIDVSLNATPPVGVYRIHVKINGVRETYEIDFCSMTPNSRGQIPRETLVFIVDFLSGKKFQGKLFRAMIARQEKVKKVRAETAKMRVYLGTLLNLIVIKKDNEERILKRNLEDLSIADIRNIFSISQTVKCLVDGVELTEDSAISRGQKVEFIY